MIVYTSFIVMGLTVGSEDVDDVDYSKYLGPDYQKDFKMSKSGRASTYVANHSGIMDIMSLIWVLKADVSFVAGSFVAEMPFAGFLAKSISTIFVQRRGIDGATEIDATAVIIDRQRLVENTGSLPPVCLYPEGTTCNNTCIMPFKRGAFLAKTTVIPIIY